MEYILIGVGLALVMTNIFRWIVSILVGAYVAGSSGFLQGILVGTLIFWLLKFLKIAAKIYIVSRWIDPFDKEVEQQIKAFNDVRNNREQKQTTQK